MSKARARRIKLILMDVDGVLTDGTIWLFPAPAGSAQQTAPAAAARADSGGFAIASANIVEAKGFHAHDGTAISLARLAGIKTGVITKRISETVALRARDLCLDHVHQGAADKVAVLEQILAQEKLGAREVAYLGDDIIDLPVMRRCGLAIATANARKEVKKEAHFVTGHAGGAGAARDAVEYILRAQSKWNSVVKAYLNERGAPGKH
ncbi:MAG TPA: HAD hydrolase family protein [Terriglobales bacterium]|nr:HAD hydrolase family protein [Terriglobales bacterium]